MAVHALATKQFAILMPAQMTSEAGTYGIKSATTGYSSRVLLSFLILMHDYVMECGTTGL